MSQNSGGSDNGEWAKAFAVAAGIGLYFLVSLAFFTAVGVVVSRRWGGVWPVVLGFILGVGVGSYGIYRLINSVWTD